MTLLPQLRSLSTFPPHTPIFTSARGACEERPQHALGAARIVGQAAALDGRLATLVVVFLGSHSAAAISMFDAVPRTARRAAFKAAAKSRLSSGSFDVLRALLKLELELDEHRNRLAHWLWAYSDAIDDGLLLIEPAANFEFLLDVRQRLDRGEQLANDLSLDRARVLVYTLDALRAVSEAFADVTEWLSTFGVYLTPARATYPGLSFKWHQMATAPSFQDALRAVRKGAGLAQVEPPDLLV